MDATLAAGNTRRMDEDTETEALLRQAREIAQRQLGEAHTEAVLTVFRRLCYEQDCAREALGVQIDRTLH